MSAPGARPPRLARALLLKALPQEVREDVTADLEEMFRERRARGGALRARWWYRRQAVAFGARFLLERVRERGSTFGTSSLDVKLGARMLVKHPGLSLVGGLALAGAIAIGAVWFETLQEELYPDLPLEDGDRIVRIQVRDPAASSTESRILHDFEVWREELTTVRELGAYRAMERNLVAPDGRVGPVRVAEITASAFPLTRIPPHLGRPLQPSDEQPGAAPVAVLGHELWQNRFGGDRDIVGRVVQLGQSEPTVVGVMPEGFGFPRNQQVWVPLQQASVQPLEGPPVQVFGRLAPGADFESAQVELTVVGRRLASANPETHERLTPEVRAYVGPTPGDRISWHVFLMHGVVFLVLGVACANVATLVFARTAMRESEIATRSALGAGRGRIVGQLVVEALVLASAAAVLGLLLARTGLWWFWREAVEIWQVPQPFWRDGDMELSTILYTAGLAVVGAVMVGVLPALKATGSKLRDRLTHLDGGGTSLRFGGIWSVIIVGQVALTVLALPAAIGVTYEMLRDLRIRSVFPAEEYLTFRLELDRGEMFDGAAPPDDATFRTRWAGAWSDLERRLLEEPAVTHVTYGSSLPATDHPLRRMEVQRGSEPPVLLQANRDGVVGIFDVDPGFFEAFDAPVVAGRGFHSGDPEAEPGVVVVNESFQQNLGGAAVGARVRYAATSGEEPGPWHEIVGVVANLDVEPTDRGEADFLFHPAAPADAHPLEVAVRTRGEPEALMAGLRPLALEVDPELRLYEILPLDEVVRRRNLPMVMIAIGATSVLAVGLLLSVAGLFALMSVAVQQRTREIGVRVALGAGRGRVLRAIFGRAARQLGLGILIGNGLIVTLVGFAGESLGSLVLPLLGISGLMVVVGLVASAVPAHRALRIEPTEALREG